MLLRGLTLIFLSVLVPSVASAWWNADWQYRKEITIDASAAGQAFTGTATEVPVLVRLHTGNFGYFVDLADGGADLRFVAGDDKTPLKHHVEQFDRINEMAFVWVRVPALTGGTNTEKIYMYYGNQAAPKGGDPAGSYDVNQTLVYHFDAQGAPRDQTGYGYHADAATAQQQAASLIAAGARFDSHQAIRVGPRPALRFDPSTGMTYSAWFKYDVPQPNAHLMQWIEAKNGVSLVMHNGNVGARLTVNGKAIETAPVAVAAGTWHHVALTLSAERAVLYLDGREAASVAGKVPAFGGTLSVGSALDGSFGFIGEIDEVQVAKSARDAAWLSASVASQMPQSSLLRFGEDQDASAESAGSTSYFAVILQNVTIDGWVVIVMLVVMAAISWVVMVGKGLYINRVRRDNFDFLQAFKRMTGDPDALDAKDSADDRELEASPVAQALFGRHDHYQSSSLYRVYHAGVQDLQRRLGRAAGAQASRLSSQAIATIRAGMDAAMVREIQRLNGQMVLLTIAISGGPFLGLLGTVVGVMITFAAIAATGDVNINAIAPGIAAALVATVAGLAVAIPALFGYNYLASRIKEIAADMQVFVDEFTSRVAEHYS